MGSSPFKYPSTILKRAANQTNTANTWNRVSWDTCVWDDGGWASATPQTMTAPPGATWARFKFYAPFAAGGSGNRFLSIEMNTGGTQANGFGVAAAIYPANNEAGHTLVTPWIQVSTGSTFDFYFQTSDGSALLGTDTGRSGSAMVSAEWRGTLDLTQEIAPVVDASSKVTGSAAVVSSKTFTLNTEAPNELVILTTNTAASGGHVTSVTGGSGLTWTQRKDYNYTGNYHVQTWYAYATAIQSAQTITINLGAGTDVSFVCAAYKGVDSTSPFDSNGTFPETNSGVSSSPAGTTTLPSKKNTLGILAMGHNGTTQCLPLFSTDTSDGDIEFSNINGAVSSTLAHWRDVGGTPQLANSTGTGMLSVVDALIASGGTPTLDTSATASPSLTTSTTMSLTTNNANEVVTIITTVEAYRGRSVSGEPCMFIPKIKTITGGGLTWHRRSFSWGHNSTGQLLAVEFWYAVAASTVSAQTITITWADPFEDATCVMYAWNHVDTSTIWDTDPSLPGVNHVNSGHPCATFNTTNASCLALFVGMDGNNSVVGPVTDTAGNTWTTQNTLANLGASLQEKAVYAWTNLTSAQGMNGRKLTSTSANWGTITDYLRGNRELDGATGTFGPTEAADVFAGRGGVLTGTWGSTEAKDTLSVTGSTLSGTMGAVETKDKWVTPPFGKLGATEAHDAFAATGYPKLTGSMGVTEAKDAFHMAGGAIPDLTLDSFASAIAVTPPGGPAPTQAQVTLSTNFNDDVIVLMIANGGFWDYHVVSSVSDTAGLTWHRRSTRPASYAVTGAKSVEIWWAHAPTPLSADVITVTTAGTTGQLGLNVIAIAGANFNAPWDVHPYANQWNGRSMFGSAIETGFASTHAAKTMTLLMSAGDVAQSAANTAFPYTFLGTVNGSEWRGGNALNVGSAYNINGTALDQSLVEFGPNNNSNFYSDSIVQAGQTGTAQEILYWLDGYFWQIGTGAQIWPSNVSIFTAPNGTVQCNLSLSSANEVAIAVVSLYNAGGAGQVSSVADSAGLASGWTRRSRKTSVDGKMALEVWWAISPTSVSGMAVTAHTTGTVANDYAQILAFGIAGATYFYDGILWDGDSSLPDEATYTSSTTAIGQVVSGMGTVNVNTLDLAFMTNFDTTQPFLPAPGGAAAYPDALGPFANTNSPSDSIGVLFKFSGSPLTADLMSSSVTTKNWVTIGDAIPVGPPQPPTGVWGSHEGVDIWSAAGFVPAFGTMNPTERTDTTGGAPNIPPFTGVGWFGWVPAFATWASTDLKDRAVAEGWVIGVPLTGVMGPTESKDRAALSNRATVTGTMGLTELRDRIASTGFEIPKALPEPARKRRLLIVS